MDRPAGGRADGALTRNLLNALGMNRGAMASDRQGRYVEALKSAGRRAPDALAFRCVLGSALHLAGPDRLTVCESLQGGGPTPALNESPDRVIALLRDGETRWERLHEALVP